jgi:hypothetical protein
VQVSGNGEWQTLTGGDSADDRTRTSRRGAMEIPKDKILELLRQRGEGDKAEQADRELPDQVDPERDKSILDKLGIDPQDLVGNLGGLGGKLGL